MDFIDCRPTASSYPLTHHNTHLLLAEGGFEHQLGGVAQMVEQENHNLLVRGSSPFAAIAEEKDASSEVSLHMDGWEISPLG